MSSNDDVLMIYITAANRAEADKIADALVREKLAACINILGNISSVFDWEGNIEHSEEVAVIGKTTAHKFQSLEKRVKELHSYECPCIVALPVTHGHGPFIEWVKERLKQEG